MVILECLLWISVGIVLYTYGIYPIIVFVLSKFVKQPIKESKCKELPTVSVIISVYNEENILPEKIKNISAIDYPQDKIEFIFGSDGSDDQTNSILAAIKLPNVKFKTFPKRMGKANIVNHLIPQASGEIIVFSDANTMYCQATVKKLVEHFHDPSVGGICGELNLEPNKQYLGEIGETSYWRYESVLKKYESDYRTLLGATGGVYAIRKSLFKPLPDSKAVVDDFLIPLEVVRRGYRVLYEPNAKAYEEAMHTVVGEFRRKVRISGSNFNSISEFTDLLHPKYGFVALALLSHKIVRWFVPIFLLIIILSSVFLSFHYELYRLILEFQIVFLILGLVGLLFERRKISLGILGFPYYFIAMNTALFIGFIRFLRGRQLPTWEVIR